MKHITILTLLLAITVPGFCQDHWVRTTNPPNGSVRALATIGNDLFAGTNQGVYYSADNGVTWTKRNGAFPDMSISTLLSHGTTLFAGDDGINRRVYKSEDLGLTWTNITPNIASGPPAGFVIYNNDIYLGGGYANVAVYKSPLANISSLTWTVFNTNFSNNNQVQALVGMNSFLLAGLYGDGVWISPTGTANWTKAGNIPAAHDYIKSLAVKGSYIFAGNSSGTNSLYRSPDYGTTWTVSSTSLFQNKTVNSLLVNNNRVYAGIDYFGVLISDDNGASWQSYNEGFLDPANPLGWACNHLNVRSMIVKDNTIFAGTDCGVWKRTITDQYNTIYARAFYDANLNGTKEAAEPLYPLAAMQVIKGADTFSVTSSTGHYNALVDTGTFQSRIISYSPYHITIPAVKTSSFSTYFNTDSVWFAVQPMPGKRDMGVKLFATGPARPGFALTYRLVYGNKGTDTAGVTIQLIKSNKLNYNTASLAPAYAVVDTLRWNISSLKPGEGGYIDISFHVQPPPSVNFNDTLVSVATISSNAADLTPLDNTSVLRQRVTGSYDPNDKKEIHDGRMLRSAISDGEKLQYTIRFQNTGNDTAFNIIIKDTLDAKLDWNSLQMINASHDYQLNVRDGICTWTFNDIRLVDSNHNESLSHGFLTFEIKAKSTVVAGDVIKNKAFIYFDYNLSVVTNLESTAIVTQLLPLKLLAFVVTKQDNGNLLKWNVSKQVNFSHFEIERSENGHDFMQIGKVPGGPETLSYHDNKYARAINYYRLKMVDADGKHEYSPIRKVNNQGGIDVTLYPNPVKDVLQVQVESDHAKKLQLHILTPDGRIVVAKELSVAAGATITSLNTAMLAKGVYLLRISSPGEVSVVERFEKW
jgi:uncharacterized repeat protein (TIGR01451 family)